MELPDILGMFSLKGQVAVVTGGGRGIGRGICIGFAKAGADVVLVARTAVDIAAVAEQVGALGQQALPIVADVTKREDAERVAEETISRFGRVDILVNNAGGARFLSDPENIREDGWDKGINLNLKSVFLFSQAIGRAMIEQGRGKIINVTSVTGIDPATGGEIAYYAAAKAGANALTRAMATAWAPKGIYVNAIAAGGIETSLSELRREGRKKLGLPPEDAPLYPKHKPPYGSGRGEPEDLVPLAIFLASSASDFITGEIIGPGEVACQRTLG
jgi:NAD(P)-dependent dehydrogenase (short-subunit alcohol dehydrogenase family)